MTCSLIGDGEIYRCDSEKGWLDKEVLARGAQDRAAPRSASLAPSTERGREVEFPEFIALVHSELSEALEAYRNGDPLTATYRRAWDGKPEGIPVELADALIRIFGYAYRKGIDSGRSDTGKAGLQLDTHLQTRRKGCVGDDDPSRGDQAPNSGANRKEPTR